MGVTFYFLSEKTPHRKQRSVMVAAECDCIAEHHRTYLLLLTEKTLYNTVSLGFKFRDNQNF